MLDYNGMLDNGCSTISWMWVWRIWDAFCLLYPTGYGLTTASPTVATAVLCCDVPNVVHIFSQKMLWGKNNLMCLNCHDWHWDELISPRMLLLDWIPSITGQVRKTRKIGHWFCIWQLLDEGVARGRARNSGRGKAGMLHPDRRYEKEHCMYWIDYGYIERLILSTADRKTIQLNTYWNSRRWTILTS